MLNAPLCFCLAIQHLEGERTHFTTLQAYDSRLYKGLSDPILTIQGFQCTTTTLTIFYFSCPLTNHGLLWTQKNPSSAITLHISFHLHAKIWIKPILWIWINTRFSCQSNATDCVSLMLPIEWILRSNQIQSGSSLGNGTTAKRPRIENDG